MAQFDAGSIVGTLDLDRDPYTLGLDLARQQAEDFESNTITAKIDLADSEAKVKLDELIEKENQAAKQVDVDVDVQGAPEAVAELESVKKAADSASGMDGGGGMSKLIMLALALAPALIPIGAVGGAGLAAFAGGVTQAVAALAPFALVAKGDFTDMQTATKNLAKAQSDLESAQTTQQKAKAIKELADAEKTLAGPMGQAAAAYGLVSGAIKKLKEDTAGPVFGVMTQAFQLAAEILPQLEPVIVASATGIGNMLGIFKEAFEGPTFSKFLTLITNNIAPDLTLLAHTLVNFGSGFANMIIGLDPITHRIYQWIFGLSKAFSDWTTDGGFTGFLGYVNREAGPVGTLLGSIWDALKNIVTVAAPFGELLLGPLSVFFKAIAGLDLAPLSKALGDLVNATSPLYPALGQIVNELLPAFVPLLDAAVPLVANLAGAFADLLKDLPPEFVRDFGLFVAACLLLDLSAAANPVMLIAIALGLLVSVLPRGFAEVLLGIAAGIWAINFALDANPIILFAEAAIVLAFGLYELVKHFREVSNFLHGPWGTAISIAVAAFFPMIGIAMLVMGHWKELLHFFQSIPHAIVIAFNGFVGFFKTLWSDIAGFFSKYGKDIFDVLVLIALWPLTIYEKWGYISSFFSNLWKDILTGVETGWNAVTDFISKIPGRVMAFFEAAPGWLYQTGVDILNGLKTGAVVGFDYVWHWLSELPGTIKSGAVGMWDGVYQAFKAMINDAIGAWDIFVDHLNVPKFRILPGSPLWDPVDFPGFELGSHLHIDKLADGAFIPHVPGGILANIGEGHSDEAVVPLDRWDVSRKGSNNGFTDAQVAAIIAAIRDLPEATGEAVGDKVGGKFKEATDAQTRKLTTVGRTG